MKLYAKVYVLFIKFVIFKNNNLNSLIYFLNGFTKFIITIVLLSAYYCAFLRTDGK